MGKLSLHVLSTCGFIGQQCLTSNIINIFILLLQLEPCHLTFGVISYLQTATSEVNGTHWNFAMQGENTHRVSCRTSTCYWSHRDGFRVPRWCSRTKLMHETCPLSSLFLSMRVWQFIARATITKCTIFRHLGCTHSIFIFVYIYIYIHSCIYISMYKEMGVTFPLHL